MDKSHDVEIVNERMGIEYFFLPCDSTLQRFEVLDQSHFREDVYEGTIQKIQRGRIQTIVKA